MEYIEEGMKVLWNGVQDPRCAPGFNGVVIKISHHDENSLKVDWKERGTYTWERRSNLKPAPDDESPALVLA